MKLRIAPLLSNKRAAPAALGLPLLLRCSAAASSLPVALAIATAKTHRNENGITSCFSPRSTCANASSPCIILSDVTTIGYGRIRYQGLSIRMGKEEEEPVRIWGHFLRLKNALILGCIPSPRLLMSFHRPPSPFAADVWGMRESRAGRRERW